jgi:hypothetical protein
LSPGNVRTLRNLIYELTSYVEEDEPISIQLVQLALAKLNYGVGDYSTSGKANWPQDDPLAGSAATSSGSARKMSLTALHVFLRSMAREGDIVLPVELCNLRRGETFKQWTARAKALHHRSRGPGYRRNSATGSRTLGRGEDRHGYRAETDVGQAGEARDRVTYVAGSRGSGSRRRTVDTSIRLW